MDPQTDVKTSTTTDERLKKPGAGRRPLKRLHPAPPRKPPGRVPKPKPPKPPPKPRGRKPGAYFINHDLIKDLAEKGYSQTAIAQKANCHPTSVSLILRKVHLKDSLIKDFNSKELNILSLKKLELTEFNDRIDEKLRNDLESGQLTPAQKISLKNSVVLNYGILFDKSRLLEGKSTHNIAHLSKMIRVASETLFKPVSVDKSLPESVDNPHPQGDSELNQEDTLK